MNDINAFAPQIFDNNFIVNNRPVSVNRASVFRFVVDRIHGSLYAKTKPRRPRGNHPGASFLVGIQIQYCLGDL